MSYDIDKKAYSYVGPQTEEIAIRSIASSKDKLYLFEDDKILEMTNQYEVLNTITDKYIGMCSQRLTNKEGKIFLLDSNGQVYCFDPFGERKATEVQDLQRD